MKPSLVLWLALAAGCAAEAPATKIRIVSVTELTGADLAPSAERLRAIRSERDATGMVTLFVPSNSPKRIFEVGHPDSAITVSGDLVRLGPFPPDQRRYFAVQDSRGLDIVLSERHLPLENVHDTRDLGGLVTKDGSMVVFGRLLRSDDPSNATPRDIRYLKSVPIERVLDFRDPSERAPSEAEPFERVSIPIAIAPLDDVAKLRSATPTFTRDAMLQTYREFPTRFQAAFRTAFTQAEENHSLLFHCTNGRDRTGFFAALLLSALGVDQRTIVRDYLDSNDYAGPARKQLFAALVPLGVSPQTLLPYLSADEAYLNAAFSVIDDRYGGMDNYLRNVLNVNIDALRKNYLRTPQ